MIISKPGVVVGGGGDGWTKSSGFVSDLYALLAPPSSG
jgi:hypothetical protein